MAPRLVSNGICTECSREDHARRKRDNLEHERARRRDHYYRTKEKMQEQSRQWHADNPGRARELHRKWHKDNPGRNVEFIQKRRARKVSAEGAFELADIERIRRQQKDRCASCKKKRKLTVDHIVPLSRGGSNYPRNLQLLCRSCNSQKKDQDPIRFMQRQGRLL